MYYQVRNYCEDCVSFKYTAQSVLDSGWKAPGCESHTVRDFTVLAHIACSCSVIGRYDPTPGLPGSPNAGDSYISTATANGWTDKYIYFYDGTEWEEAIPYEGKKCWVENEDHVYIFSGTSWYKSPDSINSETEKETPVSADIVLIEDSADSYKKKKVQMGNFPGITKHTASVYLTSSVAISNNDWTEMGEQVGDQFTKEWDYDNEFDVATGRFTPSLAGKYLAIGTATFTGNAVGQRNMEIYKNGTRDKAGAAISGQGANNCAIPIAVVYNMNGSTDYMSLWVYQNSGGDLNLFGGSSPKMTHLEMQRIGS